jgi:hypothetical protein
MHANQVVKPPHRDGWIYEEKVDYVSLTSRNSVHHAKRFPELVKVLAALEPFPIR